MLARLVLFLALALTCAASDLGKEIAERHAQRSDGRATVLRSLYAEGRTLIQDEVVDFKMWAQRPNFLRIESTSPKRKIVQIYDGRHEPLIQHSDIENGRPLRMSAAERKDFIANADFDGPLMNYAAKGNSVDYAGGETIADRPTDKLLVMTAQDDLSFLWIDRETAEIVKRSVFRVAGDKRIAVDTFFSDFRAVAGTKQPFRIETKVGERSVYLMIIARMEGDSDEVTAGQFAVPADWPLLPLEFRSDANSANARDSRQP